MYTSLAAVSNQKKKITRRVSLEDKINQLSFLLLLFLFLKEYVHVHAAELDTHTFVFDTRK